MTAVTVTKVKQVVKKLYKECDLSAEIVIRLKDEEGSICLPFSLKDIKQEVDDKGAKLVVIDLT